MCDTIQELDRKNDKTHEELKIQFRNGLSALEDNTTNSHNELSKKIDAVVEKVDISLQKMEAATGNLKSATTMTKLYKTAAIFFLSLLTGTSILSFVNSTKVADAAVSQTKTKYLTMMILDSIHKEISASSNITMMLDTKAILDTLDIHWKKESKFYNEEFMPLMRWTHKVWADEIHPNTLNRLSQEISK